jgi:hypothetical protein
VGAESFALIEHNCTCYEHGIVCRHVAAAWLIAGEELDRDPLRLLQFRGLPRKAMVQALETSSGSGSAAALAPASVPPPVLPADLQAFWSGDTTQWQPGQIIATLIAGIEPPDRWIMRRIGPPPFWSGSYPDEILDRMAARISEAAHSAFFADSDEIATQEATADLAEGDDDPHALGLDEEEIALLLDYFPDLDGNLPMIPGSNIFLFDPKKRRPR